MSSVQDVIRSWLEAFARAVRDRDFDAGRAMFASDVVSFGTVAQRAVGLDELVRRQWASVWPVTEGFDFDYEQIHGGGTDTVAWVTAPWSSTGYESDLRPFARTGRATIVLEQRDGQWLAVHTHFSMVP